MRRISGIIILAAMTLLSCKKKKTNEELYKEATSSDLVFYKGMDTIYPPKGGSPHGNFKLKFNKAAAASLDGSGKLPVGSSFNEGAVIVKEIYNGGEATLYAVMKKSPKSKFASNKWIWGEYQKNGDVFYSVSKEGKDCVGCHTSPGHRDLTRSFDLH